jgi:hypothetical protein
MASESILKCECGERVGVEEVEECWDCGAPLCFGCMRIRMIDGYEAIFCPVCAPVLKEDERVSA